MSTPTPIPTNPGMTPTLSGYISFLQANLTGIPSNFLASTVSTNVFDSSGNPVIDSSGNVITGSAANSTAAAQIEMSLWVALDIVTMSLNCASSTIYTLAVYNLATDRLVNYATDLPNETFFVNLRASLKINVPSVGVVSSTTDQGSGGTLLNPMMMQNLTLMDLQTLKTPWGRQYMGFAQQYGSNLWGMS